MLRFEKLEGPRGIPVYFQKLPAYVNPVSFRWVVFTGSADDLDAGGPGLYHWFEHVPFRGTRRYPGGYQAIDGLFARHGGRLDASTSELHTSFEIAVPRRLWKKAVEVLTELVCFPLLRPADIAGEREIIRKELADVLSDDGDYAWHHLHALLFPGHPLGHPVIGSEETLGAMKPSALRRAHAQGYSLSRMAFLAAGNLDKREVLSALDRALDGASNGTASPRLQPARHGPLPAWKGGRVDRLRAPFPSATVFLLFPMPSWQDDPDHFPRHVMAEALFSAGDLASPLYRVLREERNLVYQVESVTMPYPDGGYMGFMAHTNPRDVDRVIEAFWDLLGDRSVRSADRHGYVKDCIRAGTEMRLPDPVGMVEEAENRLIHLGRVPSDEEVLDHFLRWPRAKILETLETLTPGAARTVVFTGTK
jgi:predicted Zn-dependent peptidase